MKQDLGPLGFVDLLTNEELKESMGHKFDQVIRDWYRGIKYIRMPLISGKASAGTLLLGSGQPQNGPRQGYAWSFKRLAVSGLTTGATPDVVNLYRGGNLINPVWQFNGNNFAYTFGKLDLVLLNSEHWVLSGTITSTALITLTGDAIEVPQEMLAKLV